MVILKCIEEMYGEVEVRIQEFLNKYGVELSRKVSMEVDGLLNYILKNRI